MHQHHRTNRCGSLAAIAAVLLAGLLLAACGSSSSTTTGTAAAKAQASGPGAGSQRFSAVRECLKKAGITLPERGAQKSGTGAPPSGGGGFLPGGGATGSGPALPKGVTREEFQKALQKCGGGFRRGGFGGARLNSATYRKSLAKFSACMAENGVKLPAPNTSGNGPIFNTKGLDTSSATFQTAQKKCSSLVRAAPGAGGPPGANGAGAPEAPPGGAPPGA